MADLYAHRYTPAPRIRREFLVLWGFQARLNVGAAGLKGSYGGRIELREKHPPESLTLTFDGQGGPGFVRGATDIRLSIEAGGTRVTSQADVQVGGLIAAVGSRLIDVTVRKLADDFFRRLAAEIDAGAELTSSHGW